jgi:antitoxin VapB
MLPDVTRLTWSIYLQRLSRFAERLAAVQGVSVEEAITDAIKQWALAMGMIEPPKRDTSPGAIAARMALMEQIADEIAAMPVLDPRSPQQIMDELNEL